LPSFGWVFFLARATDAIDTDAIDTDFRRYQHLARKLTRLYRLPYLELYPLCPSLFLLALLVLAGINWNEYCPNDCNITSISLNA